MMQGMFLSRQRFAANPVSWRSRLGQTLRSLFPYPVSYRLFTYTVDTANYVASLLNLR